MYEREREEDVIDEDSNQLFCGKGGGREKYLPSLHMCLTVLLRLWVVELQGADTCAGHEEE